MTGEVNPGHTEVRAEIPVCRPAYGITRTRTCANAIIIAASEQTRETVTPPITLSGARAGIPARPGSYRVRTCRPAGSGEARGMQPIYSRLGRQACFLDHHRAVFPILLVGNQIADSVLVA